MRILIASDKFKGSLTATQVAEIVQWTLAAHLPEAEVDVCPIADGGEGTTDAMVTALGGEWVKMETIDAQGRWIHARYGWCEKKPGRAEGGQAILEMSAASGLALVQDLPLNPATASTYGTGLVIRDALGHGLDRLVIGIGGSATNDGGLGMAAALGYRFYNADGVEFPALMAELHQLARIVAPAGIADLPPILVACDVDNPLLGEKGATRVYGPQKGVADPEWFEERLTLLADIVARDLESDPRDLPGAGAAGGLGFGLMAFLGAKLTNGFDLVASQIGLEERIQKADLIITGEGRVDSQTLHGKGPVGVAQMARRYGKPVVAFAGSVEDSPEVRGQFDLAYSTKPDDIALPEAILRARELLEVAVLTSVPELRRLLGA